MENVIEPDVWYVKNTVPLFKHISEEEVAPLQALLQRRYFEPGKMITVPGRPDPCVYFLKQGRVRLVQLGPDGQELTLDYLDPGEIFGALGVAGSEPCRTYAVAMSNAAVCEIPREHFETYMTQRPEVAFEITKMLGTRLLNLQMRLHDLLFLDVRGRILQTLRYLARRYGEQVHGGVRLNLQLTHLDLARLVGASRESVSAALVQMRYDGILEFEDKHPVLMGMGVERN